MTHLLANVLIINEAIKNKEERIELAATFTFTSIVFYRLVIGDHELK